MVREDRPPFLLGTASMVIEGIYQKTCIWRPEISFIVGLLKDGTCVVGNANDDRRLTPGLRYKFDGHWKDTERYGRQFAFKTFIEPTPMSREEVSVYLRKYAAGIGPKIATRIYDEYQERSISMLRNFPEEVAARIPGLSVNTAQKASEELSKLCKNEEERASLLAIFEGKHIPKTVLEECLKRWGMNAASVIKKNPWKLMDIPGVGFIRADNVFLSLGGDAADPQRQKFALQHLLASDRSGSVWHYVADVKLRYYEMVVSQQANFDLACQLAIDAGMIIVVDNEMMALTTDETKERVIAGSVVRLLKDSAVVLPKSHTWEEQLASMAKKATTIRKFK